MRRRLLALAALLLLAGCDSRQPTVEPTMSEVVVTGGVFSAELVPVEEAPSTEAPAAGEASLDVSAEGQLCYQLAVEDLADVTAAHVHQGPAGDIGEVVAELEPPAEGASQGCLDIDAEAAGQIVEDPSGHYVDVHTESGDPAIRGQLEPRP